MTLKQTRLKPTVEVLKAAVALWTTWRDQERFDAEAQAQAQNTGEVLRSGTPANDAYINAESVCALLEKIANLYVGIPISIFLDNARYQKCALVREKAKSLNIELCFLPSYSPNLNLIERMWKFVKKKCLYSKYYEKFPAFKAAISNCLAETMTTHKSDLDSLLTLRFQLFQKAQFVTV